MSDSEQAGLICAGFNHTSPVLPSKVIYLYFPDNEGGQFQRANEFQHDVDIVIEVPEKGLAVQNGRFNQGDEGF